MVDLSHAEGWASIRRNVQGKQATSFDDSLPVIEQTTRKESCNCCREKKKIAKAITNGLLLANFAIALAPLATIFASRLSDSKAQNADTNTDDVKKAATSAGKELKEAISNYEKTGDYDSLKSAYDNVSSIYSDNETEISESKAEATRLRESAETEFKEAEKASEEADKARDEYEKGAFKEAEENYEEAKKGQAALEEHVANATKAREEAEENFGVTEENLKTAKNNLTQVNNQLSSLDSQLNSLEQKKAQMEANGEDTKEIDKQINQMKKDKDKLLKEQTKCQKACEDAENKNDAAKKAVEDAKTEENKANENLDSFKNDPDGYLKRAGEEVAKAQEQLDKLKGEATAKEEALDAAITSRKEAIASAKDLEDRADELEAINKNLKPQIEKADKAMYNRRLAGNSADSTSNDTSNDTSKTENNANETSNTTNNTTDNTNNGAKTASQGQNQSYADMCVRARQMQNEKGPGNDEVQKFWEDTFKQGIKEAEATSDKTKIDIAKTKLTNFYNNNPGYVKRHNIKY